MNAVFAALYVLGGDCISNARAGSWGDNFIFSVQDAVNSSFSARNHCVGGLQIGASRLLSLISYAMSDQETMQG